MGDPAVAATPAAELPHESFAAFSAALQRLYALATERQQQLGVMPTIADEDSTRQGLLNLPRALPPEGHELGLDGAMRVFFDHVLPTLAHGQAGPRYFGFVTGGTLPSALLADMAVSLLDSNVQVHLPRETLSTMVESFALDMILDVLHLDRSQWAGTFTTGATTSNILALSCARQALLQKMVRVRRQRRRAEEAPPAARSASSVDGDMEGTASAAAAAAAAADEEEEESDWDVGIDGLYGPDVPPIKMFVCQAHASIKKAVAVLGIGRRSVIDLGRRLDMPESSDEKSEEEREQDEALARAETVDFDMARLQDALRECQANAEAAIVLVGMGEVVTGALSDQTLAIRQLCDTYGAWLHMDAAFSAYVCMHEEFHWVSTHMAVCDSLTSDAHKTLNVPYDCGIFLVKKHSAMREATQFVMPDEANMHADHSCYLDDICTPSSFRRPGTTGPSYLSGGASESAESTLVSDDVFKLASTLPSPLHRNLENSRRFRALPVYISLLSQGHRGTREMVERQLTFAARIRAWLRSDPHYQVLTPATSELSKIAPLANGRMRAAPGERNPPRWEHDFWATTVVLFRAHPQHCPVPSFRDPKTGHSRLIDAIKRTRAIYVSPGGYCGLGAVRLAVSNWYTAVQGDVDFEVTTKTLTEVMQRPATPTPPSISVTKPSTASVTSSSS